MAAPSNASPSGNTKETLLDVQGLTCPLPVLKANKALRGLAPGARLTVLATDAASVVDFQAYCRETGHALVSFSESAGVFRFTLRKRVEPGKGG
ncbi:sulfurtransferase TusA family protein [Roseomonas populi]|uniref:Sulfurtransferase TusA family protein n=1 Tax=Roseomonas populi TaxID=3121582 RepID=A0ABT1X313_9PROT|nr:sulfurtransferase TusA family protein [Roseomonas pecuniae]MCR0982496.1 sulfurtransferase TusA family protein [Roseomonas pecuniae]